jgi:16S rRNA (uracil1498-N3)-methyltransferase
MSRHRFFAEGPLDASGVVPLDAADSHHLRHVLRLQPGEEIVVVADGVGRVVRITAIGPAITGEVVGELPADAVPRVMLVQGLAKGEKTDTIVRQATELGVSCIVPLQAARSVVRLDSAKAATRTDRWRRIAAEAAKQSQRLDVPAVTPPVGISDVVGICGADLVCVCQEEDTSRPGIAEAIDAAAVPADGTVAVVVGPEGGLTPEEVAVLEDAGAVRVTLGPTVLRTETAGVVAVALALHARGGLGAPRG